MDGTCSLGPYSISLSKDGYVQIKGDGWGFAHTPDESAQMNNLMWINEYTELDTSINRTTELTEIAKRFLANPTPEGKD